MCFLCQEYTIYYVHCTFSYVRNIATWKTLLILDSRLSYCFNPQDFKKAAVTSMQLIWNRPLSLR